VHAQSVNKQKVPASESSRFMTNLRADKLGSTR
jgi:hypothetical protein